MTTAKKTLPIEKLVEGLWRLPEAAFDKTERVLRLLDETPVRADSLAPYLTRNRQHYTRNLMNRTPGEH